MKRPYFEAWTEVEKEGQTSVSDQKHWKGHYVCVCVCMLKLRIHTIMCICVGRSRKSCIVFQPNKKIFMCRPWFICGPVCFVVFSVKYDACILSFTHVCRVFQFLHVLMIQLWNLRIWAYWTFVRPQMST